MAHPMIDQCLPNNLRKMATKISKAGREDITPDLSRPGVYTRSTKPHKVIDASKVKGYNSPPTKII